MMLQWSPHLTLLLYSLCITNTDAATRGDTFYFRTWPENSRPCAGGPLRLACSVSDQSYIKLRWTKNKRPVSLSSRVTTNDVGLQIKRVLPQDAGKYACIAHNTSSGFALTSLPATIDVLWVGSRTEVTAVGLSKNEDPKPGQTLVLRCRIPGGPGILYTWYKNSDRLSNITSNGRKRLSLPRVRGARDNGVYTCSATLSAAKLTRNDPIAGATDGPPLCASQQGQQYSNSLSTPYVLNLPDTDAPRLLVAPESVLAVGGGVASFSCVFSDPLTRVQWEYPSPSQQRINITNNTLTITNVGPTDEGFYRCSGVHPKKKFSQTFGAQLTIAYLSSTGPQFEPSPGDDSRVVAAEGSTVRVKCMPSDGRPVPHVTWNTQEGVMLPHSGRIRTEGDQLVVEGISVRDGAPGLTAPWQLEHKFTCTAQNIAGSAASHLNVLITRRPVLLSAPKPLQAEENETVKLRCEVQGVDPQLTSVYWSKGLRQVTLDGQRVSVWGLGSTDEVPPQHPNLPLGAPHYTELRIRWLQPNDTGDYSCHILTKGHTPIVSEGAKVEVLERLRFFPVPENGRVKVGGSIVIPCRAHSHVTPAIVWRRLLPQGSVGPLPPGMLNRGGNLTVVRARREYDGWYVCSARTPHHRPINASVRLLVTEFPSVRITAGEIVTAVQGEPFVLPCSVSGQPVPYVSWRRTPVMADTWHVDSNGTLRAVKVHKTDEGLYTCQATNLAGTATAHVTITVAAGILGRRQLQRTAGIAVGCAGVYVGLMLVLLLYCRHRRRRHKQPPTPPPILMPAIDTARRLSDASFHCLPKNFKSMSSDFQDALDDVPKIDTSKARDDRELSVIYSSRMYDADAELEIPLNFPKKPKKLRRKDRLRMKKSKSMYPHHRTQSSAARILGPERSSLDDTSFGHCNSEVELQYCRGSLYSDELQAVYHARWSAPFHSSRPPEPTSLDPIL